MPGEAASPLETEVLTAVRDAHFEQVIDFGAGNENQPVKGSLNLPARTIAHPPNVSVAVIQFDAQGRMADRAEVLLSRDYPDGLVVPLDPNAGASAVCFRRWDIERSDGGTFSPEDGHQLTTKGWTNNPPLTDADDIVPGRANAPYQFMAPYPASLFKSMVAFHVMRMIDAGKLNLEFDYVYAPSGAKPERRKIRDWLDPMITASDNHSTAALLKMLHERNEIEPSNREFRDLGLGTLQINGTRAADGGGWSPGQIHMTAFDTARLFWIIDGGPGVFWTGAKGQPVTAQLLSESSRAFLKKLLSDQGFNDALTTANFPGANNVRPGIPSRVADRWINPTNGTVTVAEKHFGIDIRAANERAEVSFAHKTGLTFNYGSDAGIVTSLPGQPFRHYIIAFLANLGNRYADETFASRKTFPAFDPLNPICYTQRIPALGKSIDDAVKKLSNSGERLNGASPFSTLSSSSQFSRFVGLEDFSRFTRLPPADGQAVWLSPLIKAGISWDQLVVSWNATPPAGVFLRVDVSAISDNGQTGFYNMGVWSPDNKNCPRTSVGGQQNAEGKVDTDTLILAKPADAAQIRVTFGGDEGAAPALKFLGASFCNTKVSPVARSPNRAAWGRIISTPERSQHGYPGGKGWCSPTSLSMTLARWAAVLHRPELDLEVPAVAAAVYDSGFEGTGNWAFNTAFAGSFRGIRSYVTRLDDLSEVEDWIAAGIPVILSAQWDLLLPGRPADVDGHLIVCIGFTENGDVVVNDPATRLDKGETVRRVYKREDVVHAWTESHNTVYLVYPEDTPIPKDRFGHWAVR